MTTSNSDRSLSAPRVRQRQHDSFDTCVDVAIVGAGAAGLISALAASEAGANVAVLERDKFPSGSTSLSAGLIPAAGTRWQTAAGISDDAAKFTADIIKKSRCEADKPLAKSLAGESARVLHWLADTHHVPLSLVDGFTYSGHTVRRMHGTPSRTGAELHGALLRSCESAGISIVTDTRVSELYLNGNSVTGVGCQGQNQIDALGATAVVLACNGYGGNTALIERFLPQMQQALYFGHAGNTGDAVLWGEGLDAGLRHMSAYQGHGSVAKPHGILITWAVMMDGGFQVNKLGERFSNEHCGYSEQAVKVNAQPGSTAWSIFDQRLFDMACQFQDFRDASQAGAVRRADNINQLAGLTGLPAAALAATFADCERAAIHGGDQWGRLFVQDKLLQPPYYAVRVEGALFHTQGGLDIDTWARVLRTSGTIIDGLYATGGAACGVSGDDDAGYLSGNGLLAAVTLGYIAGRHSGAMACK